MLEKRKKTTKKEGMCFGKLFKFDWKDKKKVLEFLQSLRSRNSHSVF